MLKAAVIGFGQMGRLLEKMGEEQGVKVISTIDPHSSEARFREINGESLRDVDVCIDFSLRESVLSNLEKAAHLKKNIVLGTTGWYDQMDRFKKIVDETGTGLIWSGNFSLGVNLFFRILRYSAALFNSMEQYDVFASEAHHKKKADSPSGTGKMMGNILLEGLDRKKSLIYEKLDRRIEDHEIHLASLRGGAVPGTHCVEFDSPEDTIQLKHTARNREGFARGALEAAKWISGKKGFFDINQWMDQIIGEKI